MFNITPGEFLIIAVLALIVLGPERLPDMARNLGKMIHKLRSLTAGLQETVNSISDDPSMKPLKDLGELATRPRQKLAQFAAEAEAEERAERIAREREEMDRQQEKLVAEGNSGDGNDSTGGSSPDDTDQSTDEPATAGTDEANSEQDHPGDQSSATMKNSGFDESVAEHADSDTASDGTL